MSDKENISPEDLELEEKLRRLVPSDPKTDFIDELIRDHGRIAEQSDVRVHVRSKWLIPVVAAVCLVFLGGKIFLGIQPSETGNAPEIAAEVEPSVPSIGFVPVSTEGYLINASSNGIIQSEIGPAERLDLQFEEVQHWHNPDTATNIRIFSPRNETIIVPVRTD